MGNCAESRKNKKENEFNNIEQDTIFYHLNGD